MGVKVTFEELAAAPEQRPLIPRSGAVAAALPAWHDADMIMLGGYTEQRAPPADGGAPAPPQRAPTMEAWTFSAAAGGSWTPVAYAEGSPVPAPRIASQAAVVGDGLWLVGGWNPAAAATGGDQFLNDVWRLDLRTWRWEQLLPEGVEMPRISRFAMTPLPGGRLLIHTHRSAEDVYVLHTEQQPPRLELQPVKGEFPGDPSPPSRGLHSLTAAAPPPSLPASRAAAAPCLYVFGGAPQSGPMFDDLWVLDTDSWVWRQLAPSGAAPEARCSQVAGAAGPAGRYLVLVGGAARGPDGNGLVPLNDVLLYDTQTNAWVAPAAVGGPVPRPRNAAVLVPLREGGAAAGGAGASRFLLHGGWKPFVETYSDTFLVTVTVE